MSKFESPDIEAAALLEIDSMLFWSLFSVWDFNELAIWLAFGLKSCGIAKYTSTAQDRGEHMQNSANTSI